MIGLTKMKHSGIPECFSRAKFGMGVKYAFIQQA